MANNFKVIIVGGGPVGLIAAHSLGLAGIDFVVLERRERLLEDVGSALIIGPPNLRVLHQLGLLESMQSIGAPLDRVKSFDITGHRFSNHTSYLDVKKNHGGLPTAFHRAELVEALYNGLPASAKGNILTGKKILDMSSDEAGVRVTCADGTAYTGSMILGADGAHSQTRRTMRTLALAADPSADWDPEEPFEAAYRTMWCSFPQRGVRGVLTDTQHQGRSTMLIAGKERSWIFLYEKLPEKTTQRVRYTEKDKEEFAAKFMDFPLDETLRVRDVFDMRTAGMVHIEEGIAKRWSWGRMALAGDACHKFTPNAGRGFNNGIQDVVALANGLQGALRSAPDGTLDNTTLAAVFKEYQSSRAEPLEADASLSAHLSRLQDWSNIIYYVFARYILSWAFIQGLIIDYIAAPEVVRALVLDYVPAEEPLIGLVPWVNPIPSLPNKKGD